MPPALSDVVSRIHEIWPLAGAEEWDAPGLVSGRGDLEVTRILLAVDAVASTVRQAQELEVQLPVTHHPLLMRGVTTVAEDRYKGALVASLIRSDIALLAAHTNADVVSRGTSDVMAELLGLTNRQPIATGLSVDTGIGRVGELAAEVTLGDFARRVADILPATAQGVRVAGEYGQPVRRVAVCAGAGDSLLAHPLVRTADVYVTSDLRHHTAQEAREQTGISSGPALIDVSHWAAEWLWLEVAAHDLRQKLAGVQVTVSDLRTDPWDFVVVQ